MLTDFSILPEVTFVERDTGKIAAALITQYQGLTKTVLYPGDPVKKFLEAIAAKLAQYNVILDYTGKQNLLRYAVGGFLDHIGAMLGVVRLGESAAEATIRYEILAALTYPVLIPVGNRTTADSKTFWATTEIASIKAGATYADVSAKCLTAGTAANGLVPGQINKLVDPLASLPNTATAKVANITESTGGADVEEDDPFRNRIRLAPESFTTAGSELSYVFWALSARADVSDVSVYSPTPGVVHVMVLLTGGRIPDADGPEIADVAEAVSGKKVRPLTDQVFVMPPEEVPLDFKVEYYITEQQIAYQPDIDAAVKTAVAEYETWQTAVIGRDVNPDELVRVCRAAGAKRVVLTRYDHEPAVDEDGNDVMNIVERGPLEFESLSRKQTVRVLEREDRVVFAAVEDE